MDKNILLASLLSYLGKELSVLTTAANNARAASIDEQSVAETQYDTLAIEAGYLAEGQAKRVQEIKLEIIKLKKLLFRPYHKDTLIDVGALVQMSNGVDKNEWLFILPVGAGFKTKINQQTIVIITPQSPLGRCLINQQVGDEIHLLLANKTLHAEVVAVQ